MEYTIFGESHGPAIGVTLSGLPAGMKLDLEAVYKELARRAPGKDPLSTPRKEADRPEIISGLFKGRTTGAPLTALIPNSDSRSKDYEQLRTHPRPGHADYVAWVKYDGYADYRGGGHFSGRLTAATVFAGAVAKQVLAREGIYVGAHISNIYGVADDVPEQVSDLLALADKEFPVVNDARGEEMQEIIRKVREAGDSVGGCVECAVWGLPAGLGGPELGKHVEGIFARHFYAIPAVKAVGFGAGVAFALMKGSEANDPYALAGDRVITTSNHSGGINGGITNGMPVVAEVTFRPTPSISLPQVTVDLETMEPYELTVTGRHDPCVVRRAVPVVEAAAALAACELLGIGR